MELEKVLEEVWKFNKLGGQSVSLEPKFPTQKDFSLQYNLIREELDELEVAFCMNDPIEVLDALVDIQVVLYGMVHRFGMYSEFVKALKLVNENNLSKVIDKEGNIIVKFREDGKILKPDGYKKVDLRTGFEHLLSIESDEE